MTLSHLDRKDKYARILFIDISSAFNTIIPQRLVRKLNLLGMYTSLCNWMLDFLTNRPQPVSIGNNTSWATKLSTGAQGCMLSPLLFILMTHDCTKQLKLYIITFADNMAVVGIISNNDESAYRAEVKQLVDGSDGLFTRLPSDRRY